MMTRSMIVVLLAALAVPWRIGAEPLTLEQASNVAQKGQVEIGLEGAYGVDEFTVAGLPGINFTSSQGAGGLFFRYGVNNRMELKSRVPYAFWKAVQESASGETAESKSGLGDMELGLKLSRGEMESLAYGLLVDLDLPTGDQDKALGEGFNVHPQALFTKRFGQWPVDLNMGYKATGNYTVGGTKIEPAEFMTYGLSVGWESGDWTVLTEVKGETFGEEKQAGQELAGSDGNRFEVVPGFRWQRQNLKLKTGVNFSLGEEAYRRYDWQAFVGISVLGRFSFSLN